MRRQIIVDMETNLDAKTIVEHIKFAFQGHCAIEIKKVKLLLTGTLDEIEHKIEEVE